MISSWEETKKLSKYHFDNFKNDSQQDKVDVLGKLIYDFKNDVQEVIKNAKSSTWRTRGENPNVRSEEEYSAEEYDLEQTGYGKDHIVSNLTYQVTPILKRISNLFGFDKCTNRVHVQMPGQVWNLHIDKLQKYNPEYPESVMRVMIQLTDWEQGHFLSYGNYIHKQWRAGEVTTFDWQNIPHSSANAGHNPRVTFQMTGVITEQSKEFINRLKRFDTYNLTL
jgi:hypothetical protein